MGPQDVIHFYIAFFNHFLSTFASNFKAGNHQNIGFSLRKQWFFKKSLVDVEIDLFINFGPNLDPFFLQKSIKICRKHDLKKHQTCVRFLNRFWIRLGGRRPHFSCAFRACFEGFALESGSVRLLVLNFPRNILQNCQ